VFTPSERSQLRDVLLETARRDPRIVAAGLVGSAARGTEDRWSDIDLALRLAPGQPPEEVVGSWTTAMYETHKAVTHTDLRAGQALYRAFLLPTSLQVDISWWPHEDFAPRGGPLRVVFGDVAEPPAVAPRSVEPLIGLGWLYAVHARSSIARGRRLQALHMLNGMRDQVVSLLCLRADLEPDQGRGVDDLPEPVQARLVDTIAHGIEAAELARVLAELTRLLGEQIEASALAATSLRTVLDQIVRDTAHSAS
jgi:predicted nucleotidyltransferase